VAPIAADPVHALLERQSASGLWEEEREEAVVATVRVLVALVRFGLSTSHPVHGAQTRKGVDALLARLEADGGIAPHLAELALATMWLLATGQRTRTLLEHEAARRGLANLLDRAVHAGDVRALVERLAPVC
jgi:Ca-activated chloride channel family protein